MEYTWEPVFRQIHYIELLRQKKTVLKNCIILFVYLGKLGFKASMKPDIINISQYCVTESAQLPHYVIWYLIWDQIPIYFQKCKGNTQTGPNGKHHSL